MAIAAVDDLVFSFEQIARELMVKVVLIKAIQFKLASVVLAMAIDTSFGLHFFGSVIAAVDRDQRLYFFVAIEAFLIGYLVSD